MKYEDYHISQKIKDSLKELDFRRPTDIQYKAITPILMGNDVLAIAQTGTGKRLHLSFHRWNLFRGKKPKIVMENNSFTR